MDSYLTMKSSTWNNQEDLRNQGKRHGYGSWSKAYMGWSKVGGYGIKQWMRQCYHEDSHDCHVNCAYITKKRRVEPWWLQYMLMIFYLLQANYLRMNISRPKCRKSGRSQALAKLNTVLGSVSWGITRNILSTCLKLPWSTKLYANLANRTLTQLIHPWILDSSSGDQRRRVFHQKTNFNLTNSHTDLLLDASSIYRLEHIWTSLILSNNCHSSLTHTHTPTGMLHSGCFNILKGLRISN